MVTLLDVRPRLGGDAVLLRMMPLRGGRYFFRCALSDRAAPRRHGR